MSSDQMKGLRTVLAGASEEPLAEVATAARGLGVLRTAGASAAPLVAPATPIQAREPSPAIRRTSMSLPVELLDEIRQMRYRQPPVTVVGLLRQGAKAIVTAAEHTLAESSLSRYNGAKTVRSFQIGSDVIDELDALAASFECSRSHAAGLALAYAKPRLDR